MTTTPSLIRRTLRAWEFARHIKPSKILRRITLTAKRTLTDHVPILASPSRAPAPAIAPNPPLPFLPPRESHLKCDGQTLRFTFLNDPRETPRAAIDWHPSANQLWRMHLHYMEALETADDVLFAELISSWIAHNPPTAKGAWRDAWNACTVSIRTLVWMQQLAIRRDRLPPALVTALHASLATQLRHLMANLETDLGGNHLIKNITTLLWASAYYSGPEPTRWHARALALLTVELPRQVLPDGVHAERSPSYHCQVFADLLTCRHILGPTLPALDAALARMAQATANLAHPDGHVALFNDSGLTMAHSPATCLDAFAALTHDRPIPAPIFAHPDAGYFGLHTPQATLIIDCGRIAPDDLPAHAHADVLSFELSIAGERVIVDQGVFEYLAGPRRDAARATASHNTLCFENANQADCYGAFRCGRRPNVTIHTAALNGASIISPGPQGRHAFGGGWEAKPPRATPPGPASKAPLRLVLEASHDGFTHLAGHPTHIRRFDATPSTLTLTDTITSTTSTPAAIAFLLHPHALITPTPEGVTIHQGPATLTLTSTLPITIEPAVWWSGLGVEHETHRLRLHVPPNTLAATTRLSW